MEYLSLFGLLQAYSIPPTQVRLIRHGNKEVSALDTFEQDPKKFTEYTAWQKPGKYGNAKYLAVFCPGRGTTSLFLGIWEVFGVTANRELSAEHFAQLDKYNFPKQWSENTDRYELQLSAKMQDIPKRLVIDWGKSTVSWVQSKDKPIVEIKPTNSIGEFSSYDSVLLSYADLIKLIKDTDSNVSWVNALSSVNGVYLIKNTLDGKLYVGSAYGKGGILGRWSAYASSGHGGNKLLKGLDTHFFEFSILEISPATMSAEDVIARENRWKLCLGTRNFGLNDN
ncbi:GIY-YIG nuclease family protein [Alteromonas confluentis]|uniref:GIY-YIG domain-containing protein n=1 Tax=Alteromonas confluentis TaxID=1656094 RepID=A0A1E7ZET2_9ALTE|nr:GIY-YIG nuclease family protein [Alteromonas confluentis]OFC71990.1 hypothetical protein BFC18_04605 [Alteromonas confluentis]